MSNSRKTVKNMGEFRLINRIEELLPAISSKDLVLGPGDDCAAIRISNNKILLATCDMQVEDQHFNLDYISPHQLGHRVMAVNLSDIAAMGGDPTYALVSIGMPDSTPVSWFDAIIKGMRDELAPFHAFIIGGNLSKADKLVIDITMLGEVNPSRLLTRSKAKAGDKIYVTGHPGFAGAGYHILQKTGQDYPEYFSHFVKTHLQPTPRITVGQQLAQSKIVTSMIDISDGLASDLSHICEKSHVGADIYMDNLPTPQESSEISSLCGIAFSDLALYGGEDYELLFTVKPDTPPLVLEKIAQNTGVALTEIGIIKKPENGVCLVDNHGKRSGLEARGWDHFGGDR